MARKIYYKILDDGINRLADDEWEEIARLQRWYNSEFVWTAGRLGLKRYVVFPNISDELQRNDEIWETVNLRRRELRSLGLSEQEIISHLEHEGLVVVKAGGYFDDCLASGFTRVAGNEFNAYLVCDFLVKVSRIAPAASLTVIDEGEFIKAGSVRLKNGSAFVYSTGSKPKDFLDAIVQNRHLFSVVDAAKYDNYPVYRTVVREFSKLTGDERLSVVRDRSWLGFENNFDLHGDDITGFDLNKKITSIDIEKWEKPPDAG